MLNKGALLTTNNSALWIQDYFQPTGQSQFIIPTSITLTALPGLELHNVQ